MSLSQIVLEHVRARYVQPALGNRKTEIEVVAGEVHRDLRWTSRVPAVCAALNSRKLQKAAGLELIEKSGPPSGQSTTVVFRYRVKPLPQSKLTSSGLESAGKQSGLLAMYGICRDMYREVGGAETFIRSQRENFGSIVPELPEEHSR